MASPPASASEIVTDLRRLGVEAGDLLMVHASLRAIGPVERRADGLIDALDTAVGPAGTLLMTLGARDDWGWVNQMPEEQRPDALRDAVPFDPLVTPSDPEVGVLAEVFRRRAGTIVSAHPEGRFGARGRLAAALVEDVPWDDYYGPASPLDRFVHASGKVLRLGADLDTLTLLHLAEYRVQLAAKRRVRRHRLVATARGPETRVIECLDDTDGIVAWRGDDYFAVILREYLLKGRSSCGVVGQANSELMDAHDVVDYGVAWMVEHFTDGTATPSST